VWLRLTLSLGYPPCYPSPVLIASDPSGPATRVLLRTGLPTASLQLGPGESVLKRVHDSGIGVVPSFLQPVPCACRSDNGP